MYKNWAVGWNMPGYMPDTEPYIHESWEAAKTDLIEELYRAADDFDDDLDDVRYAEAIAEVEKAEPEKGFCTHVGAYAWWIEPCDQPTIEQEAAASA